MPFCRNNRTIPLGRIIEGLRDTTWKNYWRIVTDTIWKNYWRITKIARYYLEELLKDCRMLLARIIPGLQNITWRNYWRNARCYLEELLKDCKEKKDCKNVLLGTWKKYCQRSYENYKNDNWIQYNFKIQILIDDIEKCDHARVKRERCGGHVWVFIKISYRYICNEYRVPITISKNIDLQINYL